MLASVLSTQNGQTLADSGSDHERVGGTQSILIRLGQSELLKVESQLAHVWSLLDCDLASFGAILAPWEVGVHERGLVLVCGASTGELLCGGVMIKLVGE